MPMKAIDLHEQFAAGAGSPCRVLLLEKSLADSRDILEELQFAGMAVLPTVAATRDEFLQAISA
jgi:hypothetical protein